MVKLAFIFIVCLGVGRSAAADIYQCNGQWTNKPCDGAVENRIEEKAYVSEAPKPSGKGELSKDGDVPYADRLRAIRDLNKLNEQSTRQNKVGLSGVELRLAKDTCEKQPYTDCQRTVQELSAKLAQLKMQKEANELADNRNKIEAAKLELERRRTR